MLQAGYIKDLPTELRWLIGCYVILVSIGFFLGISFVDHTTSSEPNGIIENYNGNEADIDAEVMKFKKSEHEMYNILHTHFLSLSVIFLILGLLVQGTNIPKGLRKFLMIEPLLSVLMTFGGIYLLWLGWTWMVYLVMFSGFLMTASYAIANALILQNLIKSNNRINQL